MGDPLILEHGEGQTGFVEISVIKIKKKTKRYFHCDNGEHYEIQNGVAKLGCDYGRVRRATDIAIKQIPEVLKQMQDYEDVALFHYTRLMPPEFVSRIAEVLRELEQSDWRHGSNGYYHTIFGE